MDELVALKTGKGIYDKKCIQCGDVIPVERAKLHAKYCSEQCGRDYRTIGYYSENKVDVSRGNIGAASELRIQAHLLEQGYYVLRSVSPHCPFDLAAYAGEDFYRIEVKTGRESNVSGNVEYSKPRNEEYDVLAIYVANTEELIFKPEMPDLS